MELERQARPVEDADPRDHALRPQPLDPDLVDVDLKHVAGLGPPHGDRTGQRVAPLDRKAAEVVSRTQGELAERARRLDDEGLARRDRRRRSVLGRVAEDLRPPGNPDQPRRHGCIHASNASPTPPPSNMARRPTFGPLDSTFGITIDWLLVIGASRSCSQSATASVRASANGAPTTWTPTGGGSASRPRHARRPDQRPTPAEPRVSRGREPERRPPGRARRQHPVVARPAPRRPAAARRPPARRPRRRPGRSPHPPRARPAGRRSATRRAWPAPGAS